MRRKVNCAGQQQASGQTLDTPIGQQYAYKTVPKIEADTPPPAPMPLLAGHLPTYVSAGASWRLEIFGGQHSPGARRRAQHAFKFQKLHSAALHASCSLAETTAAIRTLQDGLPCCLAWPAQPKAAFCNVSTAASSAKGGAVPTTPLS